MLKTFEVKNFRGFKAFSLDALSRINLMVGKNNVGKTALLEAMLLLAGATNPAVTLPLNAQRGLEFSRLDSEEIWGCFFYEYTTAEVITFKAEDEKSNHHSLEVLFEIPKQIEVGLNVAGVKDISSGSSGNKKLKYSYSLNNKTPKINYIGVHNNEVAAQYSESVFPLSTLLHSNQQFFPKVNAERFSELQNKSEHLEIIEMMKVIEPDLKNLVVSFRGELLNIVADVGKKRLLPINLMGDGVTRLLNMLLCIASVQEGGCFLVDEIDNGFHYAVMPKIWEVIGEYSKKRNVQIIATTHSYECINAAHKAYQDLEEYPLSVHRLEKTDGLIKAVNYDKEALESFLESRWEMR